MKPLWGYGPQHIPAARKRNRFLRWPRICAAEESPNGNWPLLDHS